MDNGEHLFRRESGRIVAALTRMLGLHNVAMAEDVAQDVFCRALEVWKLRGVPDNPSAWLMTAAKNRAVDLLRRDRTARSVHAGLGRLLESEWTRVTTVKEHFSGEAIRDGELRVMFSCCDPAISEQTQVALILSLLCGFGVAEIAAAFLAKRGAMEKRIERGKKMLAASQTLFDFADAEFAGRLCAVQRAVYLLFNEGYHGASPRGAVRSELCGEALRLGAILSEAPLTAMPSTLALCALMCFHASRLRARLGSDGSLIALADQDRSLWDKTLIRRGQAYLERAAEGTDVTEYHLEAAIAGAHCLAESAATTDWERIVWLYDALMQLRPSPVVALNRAIAVAQLRGPLAGIEAILAIDGREELAAYPFFPAALAELQLRAGGNEKAREYFEQAIALARNSEERRFLERRLLSTL